MADKFDGSINIDAKLNTKPFQKGAKEIEDGTKQLQKKVNQLGKGGAAGKKIVLPDMEADAKGFEKGSDRMKAALDSFKAKAAEVGGALTGGLQKRISDFGANMRDAFSSAFISNADSVGSMADVKKQVSGIGQSLGKMLSADSFTEYGKALNDYERQLAAFGKQKFNIDGVDLHGEEIGQEYDELVDALKQGHEQFNNWFNELSPAEKIEAEAELTKHAVEQFKESVAGLADAVTPQDAAGIIENLKAQAESYAQAPFAKTDVYEDMQSTIQGVSDQLAQAADRWNSTHFDSSPFESAFGTGYQKFLELPSLTDMAISGVSRASTAFASITGSVGGFISAIKADPVRVFDVALGGLATAAGKAVSALAGFGKMAVVKVLQGIGNAAKNAAVHLANMAKQAASSAFSKLKNAVLGIGKGSADLNGGLKTGFSTVLKYGLGLLGLKSILGGLKSAITDGFSTLMQYDGALADDVNNLKTALMNLKLAFATALAPLAQMVIPVITSIINTIAAAVNQVGMLIAALTGKGSYVRATQQQAAATGGAADAFKDETKAAKEAKKTIAGFDDLTILDDNSDTGNAGSPGGGGGGGGAGGIGLEEVPIDNKMADLAKMLKDMWAKGDFTDLGRMVGEKLRDALNKIPWDVIKAFARKLATSIATFLNGFLEVPGLFDAIGRTIAEALNTAFEFVNAFARAFHWDSLGFAIRDGILGVLNNLDWGVIYSAFMAVGTGIGTALESALNNPEIWTAIFTTFSHQVTALVLAIHGFFSAVDWGSLGHNIGLGLNAGVESFPWLGIADTITTALNSAFALLYNLLTTIDFKSIGMHIGQMLTEAITTFDWNTAGASFAALINALFNILNGFMENTDWRALGAGVITAISGFFGEFNWSNVGETVSNVISGLFNFFLGAIQTINWYEVPGQILSIIGGFLSGFDWSAAANAAMGLLGAALGAAFSYVVGLLVAVGGTIYDAFKNIIDGGLQGIIDGIKNIGAWIVEHIFTPFIDGFKSAFGIASPSTEMKTLGGYIVDGLLNGILEPLKNIFGWLSEHVGGPIINGVKTLFGIGQGEPALEGSGKGLVEGLKDGMGNVISGVGGWIKSNVTDPVSNAVKDNFGTDHTAVTQEDGKGLVEGLKTGMGDVMSGMSNWIKSNVTDPVSNTIASNLGTDKTAVTQEYGRKLIEGLEAGMENGMRNITTFMAASVTTPILEAIRDPLGINGGESTEFRDIGETAMESLKNGIDSLVDNVLSVIADLAEAMPEPFNDVDWEDIGIYMCEGINDGIQTRWDWLERQAYNLALDMYNAACDALDISSPSKKFYWIAEMLTAGLTNGITDTSDDAVDAVTATAQAVTDAAESASPIIPIETALDSPLSQIDATMYEFANKVVGGFEAMIAALEEIAAQAAFTIPQAATGSLAPYTAKAAAANDGNSAQDQEAIMQFVTALKADRITRDDLVEILEAIAREHFNFDFYIGNEQVARAANAGNARLNRRFKPSQT